jgi:hypothetical protein
MQSHT